MFHLAHSLKLVFVLIRTASVETKSIFHGLTLENIWLRNQKTKALCAKQILIFKKRKVLRIAKVAIAEDVLCCCKKRHRKCNKKCQTAEEITKGMIDREMTLTLFYILLLPQLTAVRQRTQNTLCQCLTNVWLIRWGSYLQFYHHCSHSREGSEQWG